MVFEIFRTNDPFSSGHPFLKNGRRGCQASSRWTWAGYIFNFLVPPTFGRNIDNGYRSIHRRSDRLQMNSLTRSMTGVYISAT